METAQAIPNPEEVKDAPSFNATADMIVRRQTAWAIGGGLIPVPFVDIAAVSAIQVDMLKKLCKEYGVEFSEASGKSWISTLAVNSTTSIGASMFKVVPGVGTMGGGLMMSGLSAATTFAIGQVAIRHFEAGGTMADMKAEQYGAYFREKLEEGKAFVRKKTGWEKAAPQTEDKDSTFADPVKRMEDLQKLKDIGAITEEEFETMKAKILSEI